MLCFFLFFLVCFSHSAHWLPAQKKLLYTVANPARGLLNRGKKKKKVWQRRPPPPVPPPPRCSSGEKKKKKNTRRIHMSRRYASRRHAGGLGPSRVRTRIPTTRRLGQWVTLRKTLRFRVRLQLTQSRCLSLLLAMSGRVFLFLPPRGHEPPPTLRDRLNPLTPSFSNPPLCQTPGCRSVHSRSTLSPSHPALSALRPQGFRT